MTEPPQDAAPEARDAAATGDMIKEVTRKDDGRTLIYYSFPHEDAARQGDGREDADV